MWSAYFLTCTCSRVCSAVTVESTKPCQTFVHLLKNVAYPALDNHDVDLIYWLLLHLIHYLLITSTEHLWLSPFLLVWLPARENLPHIVKMSSQLLVKHGFLIKWNIFFFAAFDYALLHLLSAANNSDNVVVHRYTILIIRWWTPAPQLSHYSIILF